MALDADHGERRHVGTGKSLAFAEAGFIKMLEQKMALWQSVAVRSKDAQEARHREIHYIHHLGFH